MHCGGLHHLRRPLLLAAGPAITNEETAKERQTFKQRFYQALELRWRELRGAGQAVVVCGDLNICPSPAS